MHLDKHAYVLWSTFVICAYQDSETKTDRLGKRQFNLLLTSLSLFCQVYGLTYQHTPQFQCITGTTTYFNSRNMPHQLFRGICQLPLLRKAPETSETLWIKRKIVALCYLCYCMYGSHTQDNLEKHRLVEDKGQRPKNTGYITSKHSQHKNKS